jgi:hypothetical protein
MTELPSEETTHYGWNMFNLSNTIQNNIQPVNKVVPQTDKTKQEDEQLLEQLLSQSKLEEKPKQQEAANTSETSEDLESWLDSVI